MNSQKDLTLGEEPNFKLQTTYNYQIYYTWISESSKGNLIQTTKYTTYATTCPTRSAKDFPHDHFIAICGISIFGMNNQKILTLREEPNFKLQTTSFAKDFLYDPFLASFDMSIFCMNSQTELTLREEPNFKLQTTCNYQIHYT